MGSGVPQFLVPRQPRYVGVWESLSAVWLSSRVAAASASARFSRDLVESQAHLPGRAMLASALLHFSIVFFVAQMSFWLFPPRTHSEARWVKSAPLYYDLGKVDLAKILPAIAPPGPGGRPGKGYLRDRLPARGSTAFHPRLTIVSNPPRPDNARQTILQPFSPPDLRIKQELRLPNILIGNPLAPPKPRLDVRLQAPRMARQQNQADPQVPTLSAFPSDIPVVMVPEIKQPHLPVPPMSALASGRPKSGNTATAGFGDGESSGAAGGMLVIGVDPSGDAHLIALPPGNKYGAFSISPGGGQPGSPGGVPGGVVGGGTGGFGTGGDGSTGVGSGGSGGGGGGNSSGGNGVLSISGTTGTGAGIGSGAAGGRGTLASPAVMSMVFPVLTLPRMRKNSLIVSAGPVGGGGLGIYNALRGGKIYTVFLPMPGRSWTLQYCLPESASTASVTTQRGSVVRLAEGLVPPDAEERFDFKRLPVSEDKADKMIVLHGVIREDGTVSELKIYQGVQPEMDEAALAAFARWKFRPALRAAQPVAVEILVGIPARIPKS